MAAPDSLPRRLVTEEIGSFFLFACVIGSGIMAANLSGGNDAIALLGNTLATGAMLFVLITVLGPISGAHMNPAVSLVAASRRELKWADAAAYIAVQFAFGILGAWAAHQNVRPADAPTVGESADGPRSSAGRSHRDVRPDPDDSRHRAVSGVNGSRPPSRSTSPRPIGSRRRPVSPTRRSRSRAA